MKICHLITRMIVGGAQENTLITVCGLSERGHQVTLLTGPSPGREGELLKHCTAGSAGVVVCPSLVRNLNPVMDYKAYCFLRDYFRREKFDVVHTHSSKAGILGRLAAKAAGVPCIVHTVHGQSFYPYQAAWRNKLYITLERFAASRCDRILAVAQAMIDQCVAAGIAPRELYRVVYSGMDMERFTHSVRQMDLRRSLNIPPDGKVIVTVARLFPQKGYEFVIPAAEMVLKRFPETIFLIVGDGPGYSEIKAGLEKRGISGNFRFAGLVAPDKVADYISQGDLLWHLSLREGLPRAVVQALACGIPAIGFDLDGTPEVIVDGTTGFLTAPGDNEAVAEKTCLVFEDDNLRRRMGSAGRDLVRERFAAERMVEAVERQYFEIFNEKCLTR